MNRLILSPSLSFWLKHSLILKNPLFIFRQVFNNKVETGKNTDHAERNQKYRIFQSQQLIQFPAKPDGHTNYRQHLEAKPGIFQVSIKLT